MGEGGRRDRHLLAVYPQPTLTAKSVPVWMQGAPNGDVEVELDWKLLVKYLPARKPCQHTVVPNEISATFLCACDCSETNLLQVQTPSAC